MGARAYRVIFAAISLPLATLAVAHFINHRCAARLCLSACLAEMCSMPLMTFGNLMPVHCCQV